MSFLLQILTRFGPLSAAKFWIAVVLAAVQFVRVYFGIDLGLDEGTVTAVIGGVGALLVWLVPNKRPLPSMSPEEALAWNNREMGINQTEIDHR